MAQHLTWENLEPSVRRVFSIWTDSDAEVDWAKHAWVYLRDAELLNFDHEAGRCLAALRFMAMCDLYLDFVHEAWQEGGSTFYREVMEELGIPAALLQEIQSRALPKAPPLDCEDGYAIHDALRALVENERAEVCNALIGAYGDETGLFVSLWRTHPQYHYEDPADIVNSDLSADKMVAFEWIYGNGCPTTGRYYE